MREIKFKYYAIGNESKKVSCKIFTLDEIESYPKDRIWNFAESMLENVVTCRKQFTGLFDKQGVEIYEGDILVAKCKKDSKNNDWIGIVEDNNFGWLGLKYKEYINPSWLGALSTPINEPQEASWIMSNCEVIGNIYENKELLK